MASFKTEELVSVSQIVRQFSTYLWKISDHKIEKIWILKNNELKYVILPVDVYNSSKDIFSENGFLTSFEKELLKDEKNPLNISSNTFDNVDDFLSDLKK